MISMPWSVCPAILAVASLCVFNCPKKRSKLVALCAVLVVLLCAAGSIASAQTAYFSGAQTTLGSGFNLPAGVAVDSSGNVYVADTNDNAVKEILAAGGYTTINTLASSFNKPSGVAVDGSGNVYVADTNDNAVKEILAAGGYTTVNTLGSGFNLPAGVAVDGSGNVYVADAGNNAVKEILATGGYTTVNTLGSSFSKPNGVAVDGSGNVYVADAGNSAVKEILAAGGYTTINTLASGFNDPSGVAVDGSGNVYVADAGNNAVKEILAAGGYTTVNTLGSGFSLPAGVAVDRSGNVYIADTDNNRVVKVSLTGGNFGPVNIGTTSPAIPMVFTFDTGGTLGSTAVLMQGASGQDFADAGGDSCTAGTSYNAGEACTVNVTFTAQYAGTRYGAVVLRNSNGNPIATGYVQGTGVGPQVSFVPGAQLTVDSFVNPWGMAVDGNGNLYVADNGNLSNLPSGVYKETLTGGSYVKSAIGSGFHTANGVAVDGAGNVYVADQGILGAGAAYEGPGGVYLETLQGDGSYVQTAIGSGWVLPSYVAVDGSGNVYVTDDQGWAGAGIVSKLTPVNSGYNQTTIGYSQATIGQGYNEPFGVAVDGSGNVFFADYANGALYELALSNGSYKQNTVASGFNEPYGVAVDGVGNVYVTVNAQNYWGYTTGPSYVIKEALQSNGTYTQSTVFTGSDFLPDVAVDGSGNLYLADATSNEAYKEDDAYPPSLSFAPTPEGSTSSDSPQTVTVSNLGNQALTITGLSYPTDFLEGAGDANACTSSTSLNAGEECDLPIDFTPQNAGLLSENVTLTDNALNVAGAQQSIAVSGIGYQLAALTSPAPGSVLGFSNVSFSWTPGIPVTQYYLYLGTTGVGSSNLFSAGHIAATSVTVPSLPANGVTVYARLWSLISGGTWQSADYTYTETQAVPAALTSPASGSVLGTTNVIFSWTRGTAVTQYDLYLGTTGVGSSNLFSAGHITATSVTVPSLPANGVTVYARLWSQISGTWQSADYTYTETQGVPAALTSPAPGSVLGFSNVSFSWTRGTGVTQYNLYLGTTGVGSFNLFSAGIKTTTSVTVPSLPANGVTVYARLWSLINGGTWQSADYTYTETQGVPAALTSPAPGSVLGTTNVTFSWTPGTGVTQYYLYLGTTGVGSFNLFSAGPITATSVTVPSLPANGVTVYARLWSQISGTWQSADYTYTAQ